MITLYGFGPALGLYDPSPFVLKVATWLRMADIEYRYNGNIHNLGKAPKKKLPYIQDGQSLIADSTFILRYLKEHRAPRFDDHLSAEQQATACLISKALEEQFYWCIVYSRWVVDDTWPQVKHALFAPLPLPLKLLVPYLARKSVIKQTYSQGISRHSDDERQTLANDTLGALSVLIGDKPFCFGERPCSLDATVYAFLAAVILVDLTNALTDVARSYPNLIDYCQNIQTRYFGRTP
ncbi:glutathione S-transferase family protein [Alteromonas gilva]|uniref:Glutathione S-transferase family protein n=1 Tax=Alteromonas gilva TaxID=2987522 RepID=A0ABT5L169_9ALTE|nr:glutathione S-transferase family protein [Alteromonas gilva]MDC8830793.1 glutathione S-transferase family protein [Alteromonas gilva]